MKSAILTAFISLLFPFMLMSQWQLQSVNFPDSMREVSGIWAVDENIAWITSSWDGPGDSTLQEFSWTVDGGTNWASGTLPGMDLWEPTMIFALNADTAFISFHHSVNDGGRIMRTNDHGLNWTHQATAAFPSAEEAYPNIVYFWDAQQGFAMGDPTNGYFELYTTSNGGTLWTRVDSSAIPPVISGEYGYAQEFSVIGNKVYFGTSKGRILKSNDRGHSWSAINTPLFTSGGRCRIVEFRDSLHGIVSDRNGSLAEMYETNDGGITWQAITPNGTAYGRYMEYIPGTDSTYISSSSSGSDQGVSISYDDGHNWMDITNPANEDYGVLCFPNPLAGWAGSRNKPNGTGGILKYVGNTVDLHGLSEPQITIWPNPCKNLLNIHLAATESAELQLLDLSGRQLKSWTKNLSQTARLDLQALPAGTYLLKITTQSYRGTQKLVKTR